MQRAQINFWKWVSPTCDQSLSRIQLFVIDPWTVAYQAPLSMVILQGRLLDWVAMPFSRGSSPPRDQTQVSYSPALAVRFITNSATREALIEDTDNLNFQYIKFLFNDHTLESWTPKYHISYFIALCFPNSFQQN